MHDDSQVEVGRMMPGESAARYRSRCKDGQQADWQCKARQGTRSLTR